MLLDFKVHEDELLKTEQNGALLVQDKHILLVFRKTDLTRLCTSVNVLKLLRERRVAVSQKRLILPQAVTKAKRPVFCKENNRMMHISNMGRLES